MPWDIERLTVRQLNQAVEHFEQLDKERRK